ncbi:MAG: hypothetical protein AB1540_04095 [Bdellovibrionota bacterium]
MANDATYLKMEIKRVLLFSMLCLLASLGIALSNDEEQPKSEISSTPETTESSAVEAEEQPKTQRRKSPKIRVSHEDNQNDGSGKKSKASARERARKLYDGLEVDPD